MEPGTWYLSRELVPFMPVHIRKPGKCGHVLKRAFEGLEWLLCPSGHSKVRNRDASDNGSLLSQV